MFENHIVLVISIKLENWKSLQMNFFFYFPSLFCELILNNLNSLKPDATCQVPENQSWTRYSVVLAFIMLGFCVRIKNAMIEINAELQLMHSTFMLLGFYVRIKHAMIGINTEL